MLLKEQEDAFVFCIDNLRTGGDVNNVKEVFSSDRFEFEYWGICDGLSHIMEQARPDIIINFAAETHVDRSIVNPRLFLETNIMGTHNLLNHMQRNYYDGEVTKYVQISTDEVYGSTKTGFFYENSEIKPSSPYSASKVAADFIALSYYKTYGSPVVITRCSNNYGPRQYHEKLIPLAIKRIQNGEKIPVYGTGENVRDWIYVDDHCRAILQAIEYGKLGEVYNIGARQEMSNLKILALLCEIMGVDFEESIEFVEDRAGHDFRYAIMPNKAETELQWKAQMNFYDGLKRTVDWYSQ